MSGSCSASWASAARSEPCSLGSSGEDDGLERRPREARRRLVAGRRLADRVADPDRAEAADRRHLTGRHDVASRGSGGREHLDRRRLRLLAGADAHTLSRPQRAREQARVRDALTRRRSLDLEDAARDGRIRIALGAGEQLVDAGHQLVDADPERGRAEEHRVDDAAPGLDGQAAPVAAASDSAGLVRT